MPISAVNPDTIPAEAEKVYDKVWITRLVIDSPNPNTDARISMNLRKYRTKGDGTNELSPKSNINAALPVFANSEFDPTQMAALMQLLGPATTKQTFGLAVTTIFAAIQKYGVENNLI